MITWGTNPGQGIASSTPAVPAAGDERAADKALALHGARRRQAASPGAASTSSSSAPAPTSRIADLRAGGAHPRRPAGRRRRAHARRARLGGGQAAGRGRGARQDLPRRRRRVARARLLDVHRHERRHAAARPVRGLARAIATSKGGRGKGGRTFLASPLTAAAAAVTGRITDPRTLLMTPVKLDHLARGAAPRRRRRHRPDHPGALSEDDADKRASAQQLFRLALLRAATHRFPQRPSRRAREILVAGDNFGCGSSREHAVVGADRRRLPGGRRALVRRHLSQQCAQERARARWSSTARSTPT